MRSLRGSACAALALAILAAVAAQSQTTSKPVPPPAVARQGEAAAHPSPGPADAGPASPARGEGLGEGAVRTAPAAEQLLCGFETTADLMAWTYGSGKARLVEQGATHGAHALELAFDPDGQYYAAYLQWKSPIRDWSAFDALVLDVVNPAAAPVDGYVLIADQAWKDKGRTYWNRHNMERAFPPGLTSWVIPVRGLFRGEAGSRNNDIRRDIDPDSIVRVDFGFGARGSSGRIVLDNFRFVRVARPASVWAFDFGPPSQVLRLGWTPVSHETLYAPERGFGWGPAGGAPWKGADRDTTFGTPLLQDFCEAGGYTFRVALPPGRYRVTLFHENSGYWGEEQAMHRERRVLVDGQVVWKETRPDGPAHALHRFEDIEPLGADIWDTYMAPELARPAVFEVAAGDAGLALRFDADRVWGSKVAALALHRAGDTVAERWLAGELADEAREFRGKAVCRQAPAPAVTAPPEWMAAGVIAWPVAIEEEVAPVSVPAERLPRRPADLAVRRMACRGEREPLCVAVRPLRDLGECRLELEPLTAVGGATVPAEALVVRYIPTRGFGDVSYRVRGHTLRRETALALPRAVTREFVADARVPEDAEAGEYAGALRVVDASGHTVLRVPLGLTVRPVTLRRDTEFLMGFFGYMPPALLPEERRWAALDETLTLLRDGGMTAVSGGPSWRLAGWRDGQPVIEWGETDRFFDVVRKHGFARGFNAYGGPRFGGLHAGYQKGDTAAVGKASGLPYDEAFLRAWKAVDEHARSRDWPLLFYAMCDETRVRETAERELEFMALMGRASAAFPRTVRTSGAYSVSFASRPQSPDDLDTWHQRFFEALDISALNGHDDSVMAEARRLGKQVHIYNQGRSRYHFGLYQWSEYRKGVKARWEWHLNILHGYQFFDLDGREPDTAMIAYGRRRIYPTLDLLRCREGAEDFHLCQTLWDLAEAGRKAGRPEAAAAAAFLEETTGRIPLNQRPPPADYRPDEFKEALVGAIERMQR